MNDPNRIKEIRLRWNDPSKAKKDKEDIQYLLDTITTLQDKFDLAKAELSFYAIEDLYDERILSSGSKGPGVLRDKGQRASQALERLK